MHKNSLSPALTRVLRHFAAGSALLFAAAAPLQATEANLLLRSGKAGGDYERTGIAVRLPALWSHELVQWKVDLQPELEVSQFNYNGKAAGPDTLYQGGGIGVLRFQRKGDGWQPYAELGLGVSLFNRDSLGTKNFSTHFQFSEHMAVGVDFSKKWWIGGQYSHYSNADIDRPNDGIDLYQFVIGTRF